MVGKMRIASTGEISVDLPPAQWWKGSARRPCVRPGHSSHTGNLPKNPVRCSVMNLGRHEMALRRTVPCAQRCRRRRDWFGFRLDITDGIPTSRGVWLSPLGRYAWITWLTLRNSTGLHWEICQAEGLRLD